MHHRDADRTPTTYVLTLRSVATQATAVPVEQRLKALLKVALRRFGLRCIDLRKQ